MRAAAGMSSRPNGLEDPEECGCGVFGSAFAFDDVRHDRARTVVDQLEVERDAATIYRDRCYCCAEGSGREDGGVGGRFRLRDHVRGKVAVVLHREQHARYLRRAVGRLPSSMVALDASRSWLVYWSTHGLALLGLKHEPEAERGVLRLLEGFQHPEGGFSGGGRWQTPHVASTYASVAALVSIGGEEALRLPDRARMLDFLMSLKVPDDQGGGFRLMRDGEVDVRGAYCALATAYMLGLPMSELARGLEAHIASCQTYEGGIGGAHGCEAHGGYTFCGVAALVLCQLAKDEEGTDGAGERDGRNTGLTPEARGLGAVLDLPKLLEWATGLQGGVEGGFAGRTNKLVDGCYSYWIGATLTILNRMLPEILAAMRLADGRGSDDGRSTADDEFVRRVEEKMVELDGSAMISKEEEDARSSMMSSSSMIGVHEAVRMLSFADSSMPLRACDALYDVAALQAWILVCCQADGAGGLRDKPGKPPDYYHTCYCLSGLSLAQHCRRKPADAPIIMGVPENELEMTDPVTNVVVDKLLAARAFYAGVPTEKD